MSQDKFKVVYTGKLKEGYDIDQVSAQFAAKFKQTPENAKAILQAGKEVVLNKRSEHVKAYKLKAVFEELGMQVRLERLAVVMSSKVKDPSVDGIGDQDSDKVESNQLSSQTGDQSPDGWRIEPIAKDKEESRENPLETIKSNDQIEKTVSKTVKKSKVEIVQKENIIVEFVKRSGGMLLGIGAFLFIAVKKLGLLKLLKIGAVMAAASVLGYDPEEACMDNSQCEDIVDDQMDICWEGNGFDDVDWDNITAEEYMAIQPKIEKEFIGCFIYETGERVFVSPIDLQFNLMDYCEISEIKNCNELVEPQIKPCYERNDLGSVFNDYTTDYYEAMYENQESIMGFYACFVDETGNQLFDTSYDE